jgi:hypothetical protein
MSNSWWQNPTAVPFLPSTPGYAQIGGYSTNSKTIDQTKYGTGTVQGTTGIWNSVQANLAPNLPSWLIPVFGSIVVIVIVNVWPSLYASVVIGLIGIILLWLTQPNK